MRDGWKSTKLGDVCELIKRGVAPKYIDSGGVCVINQKCIRDHTINLEPSRRHDIAAKMVNPERFIKCGDVLVNSTGTGTLGRVAQVRKQPDEPTTVDTHITIVRPKGEVFYPDFFGYMLVKIEDEIISSGEGASGQTELPRTKLANSFFVSYLESQEQQKRIVAILDEFLAEIETAIANTEKNLANADELFDSYLSAVFGQQDDGWPIKKLSEVCENLDSKRIPITKSKRESGNIPYYGASGVVDYVADYIFDENLLLVSEDGANLLARTYPIAFSISGKTWVNNHAHVLKFEKIESQRFIEYYLNSISIASYVSGMAQPKLNQKALNSIPIPFPPVEKQAETVDKLDDLTKSKERLTGIYEQKLTALTELKQSLLQKAFSGELTADKVEDELQEAVA